MTKPPIPDDEEQRIESLKNLSLIDTPAEDRFDRVTRLVCDAIGVENSAINLVDTDRQWGKSTCGVNDTEGDREHSFCAHTILEESVMVIPDTKNDDRFADNPFVTGSPYIRYYIGYPIHSPDGQRIGSVCGFDESPRENTRKDRRIIKDLAAIVDAELQRSHLNTSEAKLRNQLEDAERRAKVDALTNLWNRGAIMDIIETEVSRTNRADLPLAVIMVDIDDFKLFNDRYGHQVGDRILEVVSEQFRRAIRDYDAVGRYGGEEFIAVCPEATMDQAMDIA